MMRISFILFYAFAWLISLLPFWFLHGLADFIFVVLFMPNGIVGLWYQLKDYIRNIKNKTTPDKAAVEGA